MRTFNTNVLTWIAVFALAFAATSFAEVTIDFEALGAAGSEGDQVTSVFVTDPDTGYSTTVNFFVVDTVGNEIGRPILVEEGDQGIQYAFFPNDTPFGSVPGDGNDWMLGNGIGVNDNYSFVFTGALVENISLELIDFRSDGPVSGGTPGSDNATLRTFDESGTQFPMAPAISQYTVPDPRPVDGNVVALASTASGVHTARLVFDPFGVDAGVAIDNLTFTVIPEPGTGTLLGMALVLFGFLRRK